MKKNQALAQSLPTHLEEGRSNEIALAVIEELNEQLFKKDENVETLFEFVSIGYMYGIKFNEAIIWHSEMDDRFYSSYINYVDADGNYIGESKEREHEELLYDHVRNLFNEYVTKLQTMKFKRVPQRIKDIEEDVLSTTSTIQG